MNAEGIGAKEGNVEGFHWRKAVPGTDEMRLIVLLEEYALDRNIAILRTTLYILEDSGMATGGTSSLSGTSSYTGDYKLQHTQV